MTDTDILNDLIQREGGYVDHPLDKGGPTNMGITLETFREFWIHDGRLGEPNANTLKVLTKAEAITIYSEAYILAPGFTAENVWFEPLRVQLIDFGINSGTARAVRWLQRVLSVPVTGAMDAATIEALEYSVTDGEDDFWALLMNNALVAARLYMIDQAVDSHVIAGVFEEGLESRALSFFLGKP